MATATKLKARKPEARNIGHFKGVVLGGPGVGKSHFATGFPKTYYLDPESGAERSQYQERIARSGGVYLDRAGGAATFEDVIEQVRALSTEKHDYQTFVLDSYSKLWNTSLIEEQIRLGDKDAFGAYKKPAIKKTRTLLSWIDKLDMNVILICHEVPKWEEVGGKREVTGYVADAYEKVTYDLDLTLRVLSTGKGNRVAQVQKSRIAGFPEGERFNLQVNGTDTGYEEFAKRYGREALEQAAKPVVLASPEQVSEITRLVGILKIAEEETEKVLARANAEQWSDLTGEQATATIQWLKNKVTKEGDA